MIRVSVIFNLDIDGDLPLEIQDQLANAVEAVEGHSIDFDWEPAEKTTSDGEALH